MPATARTVVEIGCSSGALAREYKKTNCRCYYIGVEVMQQNIPLAERYCDRVLQMDIEEAGEHELRESLPGDCWVFGDVLEHLRDPWALLEKIRGFIPADGSIVACIPNAQHWTVQARLNCGEFLYEESGLLDKTHLRFFTRKTIMEMFQRTGFRIVEALPRILEEPMRERVMPVIRQMAASFGADPEMAAHDAMAFQYVVRAVPAA